jgi:stage II sporulation protein AA (anti-sigma F factor antagonist)
MSGEPVNEWFVVEPAGPATVVRLAAACGRFLEDDAIRTLGDRLHGLLADEGHRRLVIDLAHVARLDSLLLGKLVALHKKALALGGRVVLCHLNPRLYEVFQVLQLTGFLRIYATEEEALQNV